MAYYDALISKWATLPTGDATAQKLAAINAMTVPGPNVDVQPSAVKGKLLLMGAYFPLKAFAGSAVNSNTTHDNALGAAMSLIEMLDMPNAPLFAMSDPTTYATIKGMADAVLEQETATAGSTGFTQAVHDALLALAATTVPWWQANGYKHEITTGDVVVAGLDATTGYSAQVSTPTFNQFNVQINVTVSGPKGTETVSSFASTLDVNYSQFFAANCVQNMIDRDTALSTFS